MAMKTKIITLLHCLVFTFSTTALWTVCSNEDVPVPEEQMSGSPSYFNSKWICDSTLYDKDNLIQKGSFVSVNDDRTITSDMPIFPEGSTFYIKNMYFINGMPIPDSLSAFGIITPIQTYNISIDYDTIVVDNESIVGYMLWSVPVYPESPIIIYLKPDTTYTNNNYYYKEKQSQGNSNGGQPYQSTAERT